MACIYIIQNKDKDKTYIGSSRNNTPNTRIHAHNAGKTRSTKSWRPWVLIHSETYLTYTEARERELFLKSGRGRALVKEIILSRADGCRSG